MEYRKSLYRIMALGLLQGFGGVCSKRWEHSWSSMQLFIHKPTDSLRGLFRFLRTCWELVSWFWRAIGISKCCWLSSHITVVIRWLLVCPPYKALNGRKCQSPLYWNNVGERLLLRPEIFQDTREKITPHHEEDDSNTESVEELCG